MKRLSLSILLLCLLASNAQAFSPWQWTKAKLQWANNHKKTVLATAATIGLTAYFGYKAHAYYPDLTILAAMRNALLNKEFYKSIVGYGVQESGRIINPINSTFHFFLHPEEALKEAAQVTSEEIASAASAQEKCYLPITITEINHAGAAIITNCMNRLLYPSNPIEDPLFNWGMQED